MQTLVSWLVEIVLEIGVTLAVLAVGAVAARTAIERLIHRLSAAAEAPRSWVIDTLARIVDTIDAVVDAAQRAAGFVVHCIRRLLVRHVGDRRGTKLFRGRGRDAAAAAADRRSYVRAALARRPGQEILEVPPGVEDVPVLLNGRLSPPEQAGQRVRLAYQQTDEALLFGRVQDCLIYLTRLAAFRDLPVTASSDVGAAVRAADPVPFDISLRRLRRWERRRSDFGWIATVGTPDPGFFRQNLLGLQRWLGIGIEFTRLSPAELHAKALPVSRSCEKSPDNVGTVAGMVQPAAGGKGYALTCSHVIPNCPNMLFADGAPGRDVPDAVLARIGTGCFALGPPPADVLPVLSYADVDAVLDGGIKLVRIGGYSRRYAGVVTDRVASYRVAGELHTFPACKIVLHRLIYFWVVPWPLFRRRYSLPGDSGAWVVAPAGKHGEPERLLGMLHAGGIRGCYVILAEPLFDYFEERARQSGFPFAGLSALPFREGVS